jgi:hypothetical protein
MASQRVRRACLALLVITALGCGDGDAGATVRQPGAVFDGEDAMSLLGRFWTGLLELAPAQTILADPAACDMGLSGDGVYFAPTLSAPGDSSASCSAPEGSLVMLVPAGVLCVDDGVDDADVACLDAQWNLTSSSVVIDGEAVVGVEQHEVDSEQFTVSLGADNLLDLPAGPRAAIARGQVLLVDGLDRGAHVIELSADFGAGEFAGTLTIELEVVQDAG